MKLVTLEAKVNVALNRYFSTKMILQSAGDGVCVNFYFSKFFTLTRGSVYTSTSGHESQTHPKSLVEGMI